MIDALVVLSGPISCGKSTLADGLCRRLGMQVFKTREVLKQIVKPPLLDNRREFQAAGERLDRLTHGTWVRDELHRWLSTKEGASTVVVDSVRIRGQIDALRKAFGPKVIHVHLIAPSKELEKRYKRRRKLASEQVPTYAEAREDPTEQQVDSLRDIADIVIDTKRCTDQDILVRVTCHLNVRRGKGTGYVDVLVGGQYGSEGKGQIVSYISPEYDILVRVGGPNAGHQVFEEPQPYTHHQLPSGSRCSEARLLIGPGATLRVPKLLDEIADCKVESGRLFVDPQAMIISDDDRTSEEEGTRTIGSTGQGVGFAMARRITGRLHKPAPVLARDIPELKPFIRSAVEVLEEAYSQGKRILLEGTQGTALSLYHGYYPHVTSRDTTVSGCLAEAGIAWNRVRRAIMVCRTYPIRVQSPAGGDSGFMSQEITWSEVSRRSKISLPRLQKAEITSTTHKSRRVAEFDWGLLRKSALLNGVTDIALTFADYLSELNQKAMRFDQLHGNTINFIEEIERVAEAPVSLIATGFNDRSVIDRRCW
ncbi:MAG: adenylosuccinate synthetase [Pseudomonadota bacterium]